MPEMMATDPGADTEDDGLEDLPTIAISPRNLALGSSHGMAKLEREDATRLPDIRSHRRLGWWLLALAMLAAIAIVVVLAARVPVIAVDDAKPSPAPDPEPSGIIVTPL